MKKTIFPVLIISTIALTSCELFSAPTKTVKSISLQKDKTNYYVGSDIDLSDLTLNVTYSNSEQATFTYQDFESAGIVYKFQINGVDISSPTTFNRTGEWKLVTYFKDSPAAKGTLAIAVIESVFESIEIELTSTSCFTKTKVEQLLARTTLGFSDGSTINVAYEDYSKHNISICAYDSKGNKRTTIANEGEYTIYALSNDGKIKSNEISVTARDPLITSIEISKETTTYEVEQTVNLSDLEAIVTYENGVVETKKYSAFVTKELAVRIYENEPGSSSLSNLPHEGTFKLDVWNAKNEIQSNVIELTATPIPLTQLQIKKTKTKYTEGESLSLSDLTVDVYHRAHVTTLTESDFASSGIEVVFEKNGEAFNYKRNPLVQGTYILSVYSGDVFSNEIEIKVYAEDDIIPTSMSFNYRNLRDNAPYSGFTGSTPNTGEANLLIIPVWFNNSSNFISMDKREEVRQDIELAYLGDSNDIGFYSVKDFYETESNHKLTIDGFVSDWYEVSNDSTYYETGNTDSLVNAATKWFFENEEYKDIYKRSDFDKDGDGVLDGVVFIYAAPDYTNYTTTGGENLWAYCSWTGTNPNTKNPVLNNYFWASYDFFYNESDAAVKTGTSYHRGDTRYVSVDTHCLIHEMGHMFGLEDYYDYSSQYSPAGGFSMQDSNVGGHDAYSRLALGWTDAKIVTKAGTYSLSSMQDDNELMILTPSWNADNSPFDEYLILEYYDNHKLNKFDSDYQYNYYYPQGPQESGIRLWHVDARLVSYNTYGMTLNPNTGKVIHAMANTYYNPNISGGSNDRISVYGQTYADYNLLQLIRNNEDETYRPTSSLTSEYLFKLNDEFTMSNYSKQFKQSGKLNSGKNLGWKFKVVSLDDGKASIKVTKV